MAEPNIYEKKVKEAQGKRISRAKAIRHKCLDCCSFQANEVRDCPSVTCPLDRDRMGKEERDELYKPRKSGDSETNGDEDEI